MERQWRGERRGERVRRTMLEDGEVLGADEEQIDAGAFAPWIEKRCATALQPQPCIHERLRQASIRHGHKGGEGAGLLSDLEAIVAVAIFVHPSHHAFQTDQGTVVAAILQLPELAGAAGRQSAGAGPRRFTLLTSTNEAKPGPLTPTISIFSLTCRSAS